MNYYGKNKEIVQKAIDLLRRHKNADLHLAADDASDAGTYRPVIASKRFKGGSVKFNFIYGWFDPDWHIGIDDYIEYRNLSGESKVVARIASYLYEYWKEPGDVCTRLELQRKREKN